MFHSTLYTELCAVHIVVNNFALLKLSLVTHATSIYPDFLARVAWYLVITTVV